MGRKVMPLWEDYEVSTETRTVIKTDTGEKIAEFTTYGNSKATSNRTVRERSIPVAVQAAAIQAAKDALTIAGAADRNRRGHLGYKDGD